MVVIQESMREVLERLPSTEGADLKTLEYLKELEGCGIVVDARVDEDRVLRHWFDQLKDNNCTLEAVILTTYDCNFRCPYCRDFSRKQRLNS